MKTKINVTNISDLAKYIISKSEELDSIYRDINSLIETIPSIWIGNDSNEFVEVAINDIKIEKNKNKKLKKFGENLEIVSKDYKELESNWQENLKRESLDNE